MSAACAGLPVEWFFPSTAVSNAYAKGKAVCQTCDMRPECLDAGMAEPEGLWGGLTADERLTVRRFLTGDDQPGTLVFLSETHEGVHQ